MSEAQIVETLEKQLRLLSERAVERPISVDELIALTKAVSELASYLLLRLSRVA